MSTPSHILDTAMKRATTTKSEDDAWVDNLRAECAKALADYLKQTDIRRPIKTLSRKEMEGAAEAVTARWIQLVTARIYNSNNSVRTPLVSEYANLLIGG